MCTRCVQTSAPLCPSSSSGDGLLGSGAPESKYR